MNAGHSNKDKLPPSQSQTTPAAATASSAKYPFASGFRRLVACIIDIVILILVILVGASAINAVFGPTVRFNPTAVTPAGSAIVDNGLIVLNAIVANLLSAGYFVISWMILGASPAQLLLALQVRNETGGGTLSLSQAIIRWVLLFPPFGTVAFLMATVPGAGALIWASAPIWYLVLLTTTALSRSKQGVHDRLARSVVLRKRGHQLKGVADGTP